MTTRARKDVETREIGTFRTEGKLFVSDPCYSPDTWCNYVLKDLRPGTYHAFVVTSDEGIWGHRVAELIILHEDVKGHSLTEGFTRNKEAHIGVDSGQAGFFNGLGGGDYGDTNSFYWKACCATQGYERRGEEPPPQHPFAGIVDHEGCEGVCSMSGYGDGGYELFTLTGRPGDDEAHDIVGAKIEFIPPHYEDEEDWDETELED